MSEISPVTAMVSAIDVTTEDDCTIAVNIAPKSTSINGCSTEARKSLISCNPDNSFMEPLIKLRPTKSIPKPVMIPPQVFHVSFFEKSSIKAPKPAKAAKITVVEIPPPPLSRKKNLLYIV